MKDLNKELANLESNLTDILTDVIAFRSASPTNIKPEFSKIVQDLKMVTYLAKDLDYALTREVL